MQPLCALAFIFDGVFKGLGEMKYLRNVLLSSTLLVFIPVVFWADALDYKLQGIFIAFTLWIIARGLPLIIKFRKTFKPLAQNT
jgi:MATE family multidrug resistance protein